jgi:hypothetical protein
VTARTERLRLAAVALPSRAPLPAALSSTVARGRQRAMKRPEEVTLSREEGEALIERLEREALTAEDRQVLVKVLTFYFWLLFALREAKLRLIRS